MGESSLLLAEASVGKNAERDSHELGAREPSISTAAACVGGRNAESAPHGATHAPQHSDDSSVITQQLKKWLDCQASLTCASAAAELLLFFIAFSPDHNNLEPFPERIYLFLFFWRVQRVWATMPADTMEKQTASPIAGAPANGSHTPDKPKNASEHRKVSKEQNIMWNVLEKVFFFVIIHLFLWNLMKCLS